MELVAGLGWLALGGFFGWLLPDPFNFISATCGIFGFFYELYKDDAASTAARKGEKTMIKPEKSGLDQRCMKCKTLVFNGVTLRVGQDEFFFCFACRATENDTEKLCQEIRQELKDEIDGKFELVLTERDALLLDAILQNFDVTTVSKLNLSNLVPGYSIQPFDAIEVKNKIRIFAKAIRSSQKLSLEPPAPEHEEIYSC